MDYISTTQDQKGKINKEDAYGEGPNILRRLAEALARQAARRDALQTTRGVAERTE